MDRQTPPRKLDDTRNCHVASGKATTMITILYDNSRCPEQLQSAWGFSCLVEDFDNRILFDTGGDGDVLLHNMNTLDVQPETIDALVLSHNHWDHVGGVKALLERHSDLTAYIPAVFPHSLKNRITERNGRVIETGDATSICEGVLTTPVMGNEIPEQGLLIERNTGWTLITGCAHPGIAAMTGVAKQTLEANIFTVLGGFHMKDDWNTSVNHTTAELQELGVQEVGPCHCSGDAARDKMFSVFGNRYLDIAAGTQIE